MDKNGQRVACKNWNVYSPQRQNNLIFSGSPTVALARLLLESTPGVQCSETLLAFLPHPTDITDIAPTPTIRLCSLRSAGLVKRGLTSAGSVAAGSDGCLLGRIHFPCGYVVYVLLCCWGVFSCSHTVLPKEHSLGVIFFSSLSSCKCCIFLQFYLHFTTDYTCMIVYVTNNKEPYTEIRFRSASQTHIYMGYKLFSELDCKSTKPWPRSVWQTVQMKCSRTHDQ